MLSATGRRRSDSVKASVGGFVEVVAGGDTDTLQAFIRDGLPDSAHVGAQLEAWGWRPNVLASRCVQFVSGTSTVGLAVRGRVLRFIGDADAIVAGLPGLMDPDTGAVMGTMQTLDRARRALPAGQLRRIDVWEARYAGVPRGLVSVPTDAQLSSFAIASFDAFEEEVGSPPAPRHLDEDYLALWWRRAAEGLVLGAWVSNRCVFRVEVRPVLDITAELRGVWLAPDLRGRGLAHQYLRDAIDWVGGRFGGNVQLLATEDNVRASRLYQSMGLQMRATLGRYDLELSRSAGDAR